MLISLLCAVFGLACLLHSGQAFYCQPVTLTNALCDGHNRFLIQGTVTSEGDLNLEHGPLYGFVVYTVLVENEYRDDRNVINGPGTNVTVVTRDEMLGGKYLYLGNTYVFAGKVFLFGGENALRTGDCEYHKYALPVDLTDNLPSCEDESAATERRNENNSLLGGLIGGGWR